MAETKSPAAADKAPAAKPAAAKAEADQPRAADGIPAEHRGDVERLLKLEREAEELRTKLAEAGVVAAAAPRQPSFGMSQGTREELERSGKAVDPFTGKKLTRDDLEKK